MTKLSTAKWKMIEGLELLPQAVLCYPPSYFERKFGIIFEETHDDLDYLKSSLLSIDGRIVFSLQQYKGQDPETTTIYLPIDLSTIDNERYLEAVTEKIGLIVQALKLEHENIVWQRKDNPEL